MPNPHTNLKNERGDRMRMAMMGIGMAVGAAAAATAMCTLYPDIPRRMKRDGKKVIQKTQRMMHM
jgi:hypothetical protein